MFASRTFDDILSMIKNSNLNFHLQLSPFSAIISLKKSLICDKSGSPLISNSTYQMFKDEVSQHKQLEYEFSTLKSKYDDLASQFKSACETIENLEGHIIHYQKASQTEKEKNVVIDELKDSIFQLETEVKVLESSKEKAEEVSIRLNKELNNVRVKNQEATIAMQKEHKLEKNFLKKILES